MAAPLTAKDDDELPPLVLTSFDELNILIIDDDTVSLDLMEGMLKSVSMGSIQKATSVFAAAGLLADQKTKIDGIICDHHMEGMTGLALLQRIRAGKNAIIPRDLKFVIATGDTSPDVVHAAVRLDVNGFITKPLSITAVVKTIHNAFGRAGRLKPAAEYVKVVLPAPKAGS